VPRREQATGLVKGGADDASVREPWSALVVRREDDA
jgi:hypothetical protein